MPLSLFIFNNHSIPINIILKTYFTINAHCSNLFDQYQIKNYKQDIMKILYYIYIHLQYLHLI